MRDMGWPSAERSQESTESSVLERFAKGVLIGVILYLVLQAFFGWP